jgi:hypothetical protein
VSILTGLVRRLGEDANGTATATNRIQGRTMRFIVMGIAIRKLMDIEDFVDEFTPNPEIAEVKFK